MTSAVSAVVPSSDGRDAEAAYRPDIDGLRAIAVTAVVLFHATVWPFSSGFVGVDIFFVISGYLIGGIILRGASSGRFSFAQFYARRVRRILPALVFVIIATLLFGSVSLGATEFGTLAKTSASAILGVSNIQFWRDVSYFAPDAKLNPLLMTWSLGVEEQFYLFFPWLILLFVHRSRMFVIGSLIVATVASFVLSLWATTHYPQASFYLLPARAWELGVGAAIAAVQQLGGSRWRLGANSREAVGWLGLAATLGSLMLFDEHTPFPGWAAVLPIFGAAALVCAQGSFVNSRLLSAKPVVFIGKISYSWYLWHWPLMTYMRVSSAVPLPKWSLAVGGLVALGLAYLSWRFIEQPFRNRQLPNHTVLIRYAGAVVVLLAACLGIGLGRGLPNRLPPRALETERVVELVHADPCLAGWGDATPDESSKCVRIGDHRATIAVIGDSHAAALGPGVQRLAREAGWGSMVLTKSSCRPLLGVTVWRRIEPTFEADCAAFMNAAYDKVRRDPDVKTVVLAGAWSGPFDARWGEYYVSSARDPHDVSGAGVLLRQGLENAVRSLAASGKEVVVMGDTPLWKFDPAKVALTSSLPVRLALATGLQGHLDAFGYDRSAGVEPRNAQVDQIMQSIGQMDRTMYIDLFPRFCDTKRCLFHSKSDLLFVDPSHLSPAGATLALGTFELAAPGR